jgi:hypothetical protein
VLRSTRLASLVATAVAIAALIGVSAAFASKPASNPSRYSTTLRATPNELHAGETFTVSGCGYDPAGGVIIGFTGGAWGATPDPDDGCFSIPDIPALSGDTLPPGVYPVSAYQLVRNRWKEVGETTVTVVQ